MFKPSQFRISIKLPDGKVLENFEFDGPDEFTIELATKVPALPERSPLHENALNMEDLKVGMNIRRHHINSPSTSKAEVALVNGLPFRRGSKYHDPWGIQDHTWMLPVVTTRYDGNLVQEDWFLADMGVTPYESSDGIRLRWNDQNYTLAVG